MKKLDLTKQYKTCYTATAAPAIVNIDAAQYISITGKGDPAAPAFTERIEALYSTAYAIKFACKAMGSDFVVSKLEALWWFDEKKFAGKNIISSATEVPRSEWEYRLLIRLPAFVNKASVMEASEKTAAKKGIPLTGQVNWFEMHEGRSVQIMHTGPFATEPQSLEKIMAFIQEHQLQKNGLHHEVYLSDFRKTAPEKLKTILREPVK